jgi:hypothetical protein
MVSEQLVIHERGCSSRTSDTSEGTQVYQPESPLLYWNFLSVVIVYVHAYAIYFLCSKCKGLLNFSGRLIKTLTMFNTYNISTKNIYI